MIAVAWKHPNVYVDVSAHYPKHFPPTFVDYLKKFGQDKVLFATDWPITRYDRVFAELEEHLQLEETVKGFRMLVNGELDELPEQAFYLCGPIEEAIANAEKMAATV